MKNNKVKKGFTLIELLVVIGIIAIVASIFIVITKSARDKTKDASIQSHIDTIKKQSLIFSLENNNSYLPTNPGEPSKKRCSEAIDPSATWIETMFNETYDEKIATVLRRVDGLKPSGNTNMWCANNSDSWAVATKLNQKANGNDLVWCADSGGGAAAYTLDSQFISQFIGLSSGVYYCRQP